MCDFPNSRLSSVICSTVMPVKSARNRLFARSTFSFIADMICSFSERFMVPSYSLKSSVRSDNRPINPDAGTHRRGERDASDILALRAGRLDADNRIQECLDVLNQFLPIEVGFSHYRVNNPRLVDPEFNLTGLHFRDRLADVHGDGAALGIGHKAAGAEHFPQ